MAQHKRPISTPFGSVQDNLRDLHIKGTVPPGAAPEVNVWHPNHDPASEAMFEGLYLLGTPLAQEDRLLVVTDQVEVYAIRDLAGPPPYLVGLTLDIEIMTGSVLYTPITITFTAGTGALPANPDVWTPDDIRLHIHTAIAAAIAPVLHPAWATLSNEDTIGAPGDTGRLRIWARAGGGGPQPGDYIRVLSTTDSLVYDILGFYSDQIAYSPQPVTVGNDVAAMFNVPGNLALGTELMAAADSFYYEVANRPLLNLAEDLRILRSQFMLLRDGIFGETDEPVQAAFLNTKRFHGDLHLSWNVQTAREFADDEAKIYLDFLAANLPAGTRVANSPATYIDTDQAGGGAGNTPPNWNNRLFGVEFTGWSTDWFTSLILPLEHWSYVAEVHSLVAPPGSDIAYTVFGPQFSMDLFSDTADGIGGGSDQLTTIVNSAIFHSGYTAGFTVYNKWHPPYGLVALAYTGESFGFATMNPDYGLGSQSEFIFRPTRDDAVPGPPYIGGGIAEGGFVYDLAFTNQGAGLTDIFGHEHRLPWLGGGVAPYDPGIRWFNETVGTAARYLQTSWTNDTLEYYVENIGIVTPGDGFLIQVQRQNITGWFAEDLGIASPFFKWLVDDFIRMEIEGSLDLTPLALRLDYANTVQTELVFGQTGIPGVSSPRLIQWREGTSFGVLGAIDETADEGTIHFTLPPLPAPVVANKFQISVVGTLDSIFAAYEYQYSRYFNDFRATFAMIGENNAQPKILGFAPQDASHAFSGIGWDIQLHRPRADAAGEYQGGMPVYRGSEHVALVNSRELVGELPSNYRVFTPNDYWWDISEAIGGLRYGRIRLLDSIFPAAPTWTTPIAIYRRRNGLGLQDEYACTVVGQDTISGEYLYILEGARLLENDLVVFTDGSGVKNTDVMGIVYQPKGKILLTSGTYMPRHRVYLSAVPAAAWTVGEEITASVGGIEVAVGSLIERGSDAVGEYADIVNSVGTWTVAATITNGVSIVTIDDVRYPIEFPTYDTVNGGTDYLQLENEFAAIEVVGEGDVILLGHAGLIRIIGKEDTGFDRGFMTEGGTQPPLSLIGADIGTTFRNIRFGSFVNRVTAWTDSRLTHGIVIMDKWDASGIGGSMDAATTIYGLKFEDCHFDDRLIYFRSDLGIIPADETLTAWNLSVEVRRCKIDPTFMRVRDASASYAYLVAQDDTYLVEGGINLHYGFDQTAYKYGPCLLHSRFEDIEVLDGEIPDGATTLTPFRVSSLVDVTFENIRTQGAIHTSTGPYDAVCEYYSALYFNDCDFYGNVIQIGQLISDIAYDSSLSVAGVTVGDIILLQNGRWGEVLEIVGAAPADTTARVRLLSIGMPLAVYATLADDLYWFAQGTGVFASDLGVSHTGDTDYFEPSTGIRFKDSNAGSIKVHAGHIIFPAYNGSVIGEDYRDVVVKDCGFFRYNTPCESVYQLQGTFADFVGCLNVQFSENAINADTMNVFTSVDDDSRPSFLSAVSYRSCFNFEAHENSINGFIADDTTAGASPASAEGTSVYLFYGAYSIASRIESNNIALCTAGSAITDSAAVNASMGGDFVVAYFASIQDHIVKENKIIQCYAGYAAGANPAFPSGNFINVYDGNQPDDLWNWRTGATTTAALIPFAPVITYAHTLQNQLDACAARHGVDIVLAAPVIGEALEAWTSTAGLGTGGSFYNWLFAMPDNSRSRTFYEVDVSDNRFSACSSGDGGDNAEPASVLAGGIGGDFMAARFYMGDYKAKAHRLATDRNKAIVCTVGNGGNSTNAVVSAGRGGSVYFQRIHMGCNGPFAAGELTFDDVSCNRNTCEETNSGSKGSDSSLITLSGELLFQKITTTDYVVGGVFFRNVACTNNQFTNSIVGDGDCGWDKTAIHGTASSPYTGFYFYDLATSFGFCEVQMPGPINLEGTYPTAVADWDYETHFISNLSVSGNKARFTDTTDVVSSIFFALRIDGHAIYDDIPGSPPPPYGGGWEPMPPATVRGVVIEHNELSIAGYTAGTMTATKFLYTCMDGSLNPYFTSVLWDVLIASNNWHVDQSTVAGGTQQSFDVLPNIAPISHPKLVLELRDAIALPLFFVAIAINPEGYKFIDLSSSGSAIYHMTDEEGTPFRLDITILNSYINASSALITTPERFALSLQHAFNAIGLTTAVGLDPGDSGIHAGAKVSVYIGGRGSSVRQRENTVVPATFDLGVVANSALATTNVKFEPKMSFITPLHTAPTLYDAHRTNFVVGTWAGTTMNEAAWEAAMNEVYGVPPATTGNKITLAFNGMLIRKNS